MQAQKIIKVWLKLERIWFKMIFAQSNDQKD